MQFWQNLYKDEQKINDMRVLKDYMEYNYNEGETTGPTYEEINEIMQNINENKATSSIIKPQIIKLGSIWGHQIIYRIIK